MKNFLKVLNENKIPLIIALLTTVIFFNSQLFGDFYFWEDFTEYVFPTQTFAARESQGFDIPFWNPYVFNGMPFFADLQAGFLYPLNRLLNLFVASDGTLPVAAVQMIIILHFFISQINFYSLARSYRISQQGAMIGAVSYSFSLLMVCHVIHPMMLYHLTWFPLILNLFNLNILFILFFI